MAGLTRGKGAKTARSHGISRRIKRNVPLCRQPGTERRRKFCIGDNIAGAVGMKYSKSEVEQTIPQSAMRQTAPFAQGSHGGGSDGFAQGSHDVGRGTKPTPFMPPFMVRGSVALTNHASPYGKGRCHKVTEGIRSSDFDIVNRKSDRQSLSLPCGRQLPLHKGAMVGAVTVLHKRVMVGGSDGFAQESHGWGHGCGISAFYKGIGGECARGLWPLFRFVVFEAVFGALGRPFVIAEKIVGRDVQPIA